MTIYTFDNASRIQAEEYLKNKVTDLITTGFVKHS